MQLPSTKMFIPFIVAGYPTEEATIEIALSLQQLGAAALELGIPYSDPLADGPTIQQAYAHSLAGGMTMTRAIQLAGEMRQRGVTIPIVLFTYINPVLQLGYERFFSLMNESGVEGVLIPDLPFEEGASFRARCEAASIDFISLVAPTSDERLARIAREAKGFLYCVSTVGITGTQQTLPANVESFVAKAKASSPVPVAVGFGISTAEHVAQLLPHADGIIIGSKIIQIISKTFLAGNETPVVEFAREVSGLLTAFQNYSIEV